jgi:hypothetical protein
MAILHVIECDSCGKRYEGSTDNEVENSLVKINQLEFPSKPRRAHQDTLHFCDGTCASEWFLQKIGRLYVDA